MTDKEKLIAEAKRFVNQNTRSVKEIMNGEANEHRYCSDLIRRMIAENAELLQKWKELEAQIEATEKRAEEAEQAMRINGLRDLDEIHCDNGGF